MAMARRRGGEYLPLTSKALHTIVKAGAIPSDFECLNPFRRTKDFDTTATFANYQHQYVLDDTGGGISTGVTYRRVPVELAGNGEGTGSGGTPLVLRGSSKRSLDLLLSKNAGVNAEAVAATRSVVLAIERAKRCRVLRLYTDFIFDEDDELWLAGVTFCEVAARQTIHGAPREKSDPHGRREGEERVLATELRSRKHRADETSDVLADENFTRLLRRIGYASPIKRRAGVRKVCDGRRSRPTHDPTTRRSTATARETGGSGEDTDSDFGSVTASQGVAMSNTDGQQRTSASLGAGSTCGISFDWDPPGCGEASTATNLGSDASDGGGPVNKSPSLSCSPRDQGFDSSVVELDPAATNRIYGSTQVQMKGPAS